MSSGRAPEWATGGGDEEGNDALLDAPELRVVLLGTIGSGKTLSGDTLLWRSEVAAPQRSGLQCVWRRGAAEGRRLSVVVGPRWLWRQGRLEEGVRQETERALALCAPGPHAFLLVVPVGQFSELDLQAAREICHMFGEAALARHGLLLLTCGDYLGGASVDDHLLTAGPELREVLAQCGGRCHVLNNRRPADRAQVRQLLEKVEEMVRETGGCYTRGALQGAPLEAPRGREPELIERSQQGAPLQAPRGREGELIERSQQGAPLQAPRGREEELIERSQQGAPLQAPRGREEELIERSQQGREQERSEEEEGRRRMEAQERKRMEEEARKMKEARRKKEEEERRRMEEEMMEERKMVVEQQKRKMMEDERKMMVEQQKRKMIEEQERRKTMEEESRKSEEGRTQGLLHALSSSQGAPQQGEGQEAAELQGADASDGALQAQLSDNSPNNGFIQRLWERFFSASADCSPARSSSSSSPLLDAPDPSELRLVLLGRAGAGAGAAAAALLGREELGGAGGPLQCEKRRGVAAGRKLAVIVTPAGFLAELSPEQVTRCATLAAPGPHALLLCVPVSEPAAAELRGLDALAGVFGPGLARHALVLFTRAEQLRPGLAVEDYVLSAGRADLQELVERCEDRYHVLGPGPGAAELLEKVEQMVRENRGRFFAGPLFQEAEARLRRRQEEMRAGPGAGPGAGGGAREEAEQCWFDLGVSPAPRPAAAPPSRWSRALRDLLRRLPTLTTGAAVLGGVLGVLVGGPLGAAVGATVGSLLTEVGKRKYTVQQ